MMQEDLRAVIQAASTGASVVAWNARPQGSSLPAILLHLISEEVTYTYQGQVDLVTSRVQVDIYANSYASALSVDRALVPELSGYTGIEGATEFGAIFLESRFDAAEEADGGALLHRISRDLMVKHKEA